MTRYFPEVVEAVAGEPAREVRRRRRDRRRRRRAATASTSTCCSSASTRPPAGCKKLVGRDAGARSSPSTCSRSATRTCIEPAVRRAAGAAREGAGRRRRRRSTSPPRRADRDVAAGLVHRSSRAPASTASSPSRSTAPTSPTSALMFKIKHERTADCVVAGYRVHKSGPTRSARCCSGSTTTTGSCASVGVIGAFPMARRKELFEELQPLVDRLRRPPVGLGARRRRAARTPRTPSSSRWNGRQGPVLHAAAARAGRRGALRPHGGRPLPAHRAVRALAPGPRRRESCTYRAARRAGQLRPRRRAGQRPVGRGSMAERWDTGRRELVRRAAIGAAITGGSVTALGAPVRR